VRTKRHNPNLAVLNLIRSDLNVKSPHQCCIGRQFAAKDRALGDKYKLRAAIAVLASMVLFTKPQALSAQVKVTPEYEVKARFLYHFAQFVEWPENVFKDGNSPLVYCTVGQDLFQGALEASFKGKTIGTHSLQVRRFNEVSEAQGCHVMFLGKPTARSIPEELASLKGSPVLTVGETNQFVDEHGMIGFSVEENKIRFEVNLDSAEKAHLKISAKLLALAKRVIVG